MLPQTLLDRGTPFTTFRDADNALTRALEARGYERSYWSIPNGFAIVTRFEKIESDGSYEETERYSYGPSTMRDLSLIKYVRALFSAPPGHYRQILFVITDVPFSQVPADISAEDARRWLYSGLNALPEDIAALPWKSLVRCTALIYEFEWDEERGPRLVRPSRLRAKLHLERAGLLAALKR